MSTLIDIPSPGWPLCYGVEGSPAVVLVHDSYGRLPFLESYATALAKLGYYVVVPDLFNGVAAIDDAGLAELRERSDIGFADATLDDAIGMARGTARGTSTARVGVIGIGLGGWYALRAAQRGEADAVITYYAGLQAEEGGIIPCPVLLHFSESGDWGSSLEADEFVSRLKEVGTPVTRHLYPETGDHFANATLVELLDRPAAGLAFARSASFLQAQLVD
jgi:carboxymethylenebutenolidase